MSDAAIASPLLYATVLLLYKAKEQSITYLDIYTATNLKPNWLSALANDKIKEPSILKVQRLHDYLMGVVHDT